MWLVVLIVRDRTPDHLLLNVLAVVEVALLVHLVLGHRAGDGRRAGDGVSQWEYIGYLIGVRPVIPAGVIWSSGEQSRGGTAVSWSPCCSCRSCSSASPTSGPPVADHADRTGTGRGFGRVLVFVYGVFALAATGRSTLQLATKASEAPVPYALSAVAAVVYIVATFALATNRRRLALVTVGIELVGVLAVGRDQPAAAAGLPGHDRLVRLRRRLRLRAARAAVRGLWWLLRQGRAGTE